MIRILPETGSTNADLAARLRAGEAVAEGDWLVLVFNKAAQFMDADAALELGIQLGVVDTRTMVLNESIPKLTERFDANKNGLIDAGAEASAYIAQLMGITDALESMPKEIDITVTIKTTKYKGRKVRVCPYPAGGFEYDFEQYGGPVNATQPYFVGEVGPELFVPNTPGRIIPNNRMGDYGGGMGGGIVIHNHSAGAAALSWSMVRSHQKRRIQRSMGG